MTVLISQYTVYLCSLAGSNACLTLGGGSFHEAQLRRRRQEQQRPRDRLVVQV